jgi:hypothetical protein
MEQANDKAVTPRFRNEGEGYPLKSLDTSYTPVYYGFNCTPRQVKYYRMEKGVEMILKGYCSRSVAEAYLAIIEAKWKQADDKYHEYETKIEELNNESKGLAHSIRKHYRKSINQIANRQYNYGFKVRGIGDCVARVKSYLAESSTEG